MSGRRPLILLPAARADIREILVYTREQWGAEQRRQYKDQLNRGIRALAEYPELGQQRDEFFVGCRSLIVQQHVVFYRLSEGEIIIGRVLHTSQTGLGKVDF